VENVFIELKPQNVNNEKENMTQDNLIESDTALIEISWNLEVN
jgi:hypothetical protein